MWRGEERIIIIITIIIIIIAVISRAPYFTYKGEHTRSTIMYICIA